MDKWFLLKRFSEATTSFSDDFALFDHMRNNTHAQDVLLIKHVEVVDQLERDALDGVVVLLKELNAMGTDFLRPFRNVRQRRDIHERLRKHLIVRETALASLFDALRLVKNPGPCTAYHRHRLIDLRWRF